MPIVSVVMPVKGSNSTFLAKSIQSILNQTLKDFELLLIIDASDFNQSNQIHIPSYMMDDPRIRVVKNKKRGFIEALNVGIAVSKGKYIARMDSDDISFPNRLELQIKTIEQGHFDLVGAWAYIIDEQGVITGKLMPPTDSNQIRRTIMLHNPFLHSAVLFKKSVLFNTGVYNQALLGAEDYDLWLRIVSLNYKYSNIPDFLVSLRETTNSIMRSKTWVGTRINYVRVKALGLTKLGFRDPVSFISCFIGPLSFFVPPQTVSRLKYFLNLLERSSLVN